MQRRCSYSLLTKKSFRPPPLSFSAVSARLSDEFTSFRKGSLDSDPVGVASTAGGCSPIDFSKSGIVCADVVSDGMMAQLESGNVGKIYIVGGEYRPAGHDLGAGGADELVVGLIRSKICKGMLRS